MLIKFDFFCLINIIDEAWVLKMHIWPLNDHVFDHWVTNQYNKVLSSVKIKKDEEKFLRRYFDSKSDPDNIRNSLLFAWIETYVNGN